MTISIKIARNKNNLIKMRREWILILLTFILVFSAIRFENHLITSTAKLPLSSSILVLAIININILLIIFFLFLVMRNLFRLTLERRQGVPGARLRTKLVVAFVGLSLIPTMLLFFVAAGFITTSIENWFNSQIESSLQESLEVAQTYYKNSEENALYYADQLAMFIREENLLRQGKQGNLEDLIRKKQREYNLGAVEIFSAKKEELVRAFNSKVPFDEFTDPSSETITEALQGKRFSRISSIGKADLIRGVVPVYSNWSSKEAVGVVVVNYYVPNSLVAKMKEISNSFEQFKSTKMVKKKIKKGYLIFLLLIAMVLIFLATWVSFHLARGITVPIQELAIATNRIAAGDLDVRLEKQSEDEVGLLLDSFNTMAADLRKNQQEIRQANQDLQISNLELDQRRRYMEIVLENVTAGVISVNKQGNITTVNNSAEKLLGIKAGGKILGKNFRDVVDSDYLPVIKNFLLDLRESGKDSIRKQLTLKLRDNRVTLLVNVTTLRDENGEFMGTVVVFDDLTHLIKAQRMAAWREVARRIAHEIKNPLTPIQLSAQRLRRRYLDRFSQDDRVFDDCTNLIVKQVEELKNLVNEFSNFARMPASNPTLNNLNEVLREALVLYKEGHKEISFEFSTDPQIPAFSLDRDQMKRAVINLLDNAVGAINEDGRITVESSFNPTLQMVMFAVSDNGCGISAEDKPRLFEPYFSTKKSGTGLGLAIVSTIISDHGGYIRVKDNTPRGTKFVIELPVSGATAPT